VIILVPQQHASWHPVAFVPQAWDMQHWQSLQQQGVESFLRARLSSSTPEDERLHHWWHCKPEEGLKKLTGKHVQLVRCEAASMLDQTENYLPQLRQAQQALTAEQHKMIFLSSKQYAIVRSLISLPSAAECVFLRVPVQGAKFNVRRADLVNMAGATAPDAWLPLARPEQSQQASVPSAVQQVSEFALAAAMKRGAHFAIGSSLVGGVAAAGSRELMDMPIPEQAPAQHPHEWRAADTNNNAD
jgi:hypothetical protein